LRPPEYAELTRRVRELVESVTPSGSTVLVATRGDPELLDLDGRTGWHFPRDESGAFAGYYPSDTAAVVEHVDELRAGGADYLVFPATSLWWLEKYEGLREQLERSYPLARWDSDVCAIFGLREAAPGRGGPAGVSLSGDEAASVRRMRGLLDALLPPGAVLAVAGFDERRLAALDGRRALELPLTRSAAEAVARLDDLCAAGARFLVIPSEAFDWLEGRPELGEHLRQRHRFVTRQQHLCEIYELAESEAGAARAGRSGRRPQRGPGARGLFSRLTRR
jgi:hypothetical protein